jgi:hypothetical protein
MSEKKELSPLAKQLLGGAGTIDLFTQTEFDEALALARAEIMTVAIETTKQAIRIEREECAKLVEAEDEYGYKELAERIPNRIPSQRQ